MQKHYSIKGYNIGNHYQKNIYLVEYDDCDDKSLMIKSLYRYVSFNPVENFVLVEFKMLLALQQVEISWHNCCKIHSSQIFSLLQFSRAFLE